MIDAADAIVADRPLLVSATPGEIEHVHTDLPRIVVGVGGMNAAIHLTAALTAAKAKGIQPSCLINVGTAGALKASVSGVFEIGHVYKHDFNDDVLEAIDGKPALNDLLLETSGVLPTATLATGDSFVADSATRERLAGKADLVEMEGYVIARIGFEFGIPVVLIKQTSDMADESAIGQWADAVDGSSRHLDRALAAYCDSGHVAAVPTPQRAEFRR
ncbi:nucleosidase [Corynebacterium choanae]|uniref:5'-methylthioadenosine/S-adenosylhomocysteine nucleosidase n=1 Tax=Corynebacterium choanae TaxID=1862358 RepID=A0A3G6J9B6_9CORY|nr:nucleosidase [Corynebacterium choanae]AZA12624.1 5'-methylthioadenosine/S-adenosylhomocysteine nucleosidase [Corynebacterium choanae]